MRITKKMLAKQNELLKVVIFVLLVIIFVWTIMSSFQIPEIKNLLNKTNSNTQEIIDILTIGE